MIVHDALIPVKIVSPQSGQELVPCESPVRISEEEKEHLILLRRERAVRSPDSNAPGTHIHCHTASGDKIGYIAAPHTPCHRHDLRIEHGQGKWFGNIVVRARRVALQLILLHYPRCDEKYRRVCLFPHLPAHREAVPAGKHYIQQDHLPGSLHCLFHSVLPVIYDLCLPSLRGKIVTDCLRQQSVILHDQKPESRIRFLSPVSFSLFLMSVYRMIISFLYRFGSVYLLSFAENHIPLIIVTTFWGPDGLGKIISHPAGHSVITGFEIQSRNCPLHLSDRRQFRAVQKRRYFLLAYRWRCPAESRLSHSNVKNDIQLSLSFASILLYITEQVFVKIF